MGHVSVICHLRLICAVDRPSGFRKRLNGLPATLKNESNVPARTYVLIRGRVVASWLTEEVLEPNEVRPLFAVGAARCKDVLL